MCRFGDGLRYTLNLYVYLLTIFSKIGHNFACNFDGPDTDKNVWQSKQKLVQSRLEYEIFGNYFETLRGTNSIKLLLGA